jgi:hypothetical protein
VGVDPTIFMHGLDPRIHQSSERILAKMMDCRVKPAMTTPKQIGGPERPPIVRLIDRSAC